MFGVHFLPSEPGDSGITESWRKKALQPGARGEGVAVSLYRGFIMVFCNAEFQLE